MDQIWDQYNRNSRGWAFDPIAQVHPRIYLGSAENVDHDSFRKRNITHVINCAQDWACPGWFKVQHPDRYRCMEADDTHTFNILSCYPKFEQAMNQFLADPSCRNIYVHCECGINRSAFLLLIYMCVKFRYPIDMVAKNILIQRPCCFRNTSFRKQAIEYIKKLD